MRGFLVVFATFLFGYSSISNAMDLSLSIQPVLPKEDIVKGFQPLADYLSSQTGHNIRIKPYRNFITYWADMRRGNGFDLVLDAAHFTGYRVLKKNYEVLAKLPDSVSFTIVTHQDDLILDTDELILKKMATMVSPSVGALRLLEVFDDPMRQPKIVYARDSLDAAQMVLSKKVTAAIIPTALVSRFEGLNTVKTTASLPHMGFSASPEVPADVRASIKKALVGAKDTAEGKAMLSKLNYSAFEPATAEDYKKYAALLKNVLGY